MPTGERTEVEELKDENVEELAEGGRKKRFLVDVSQLTVKTACQSHYQRYNIYMFNQSIETKAEA